MNTFTLVSKTVQTQIF